IYVAPPDHHMVLGSVSIRLNQGPKVHYTRPAAGPLFISAAEACCARVPLSRFEQGSQVCTRLAGWREMDSNPRSPIRRTTDRGGPGTLPFRRWARAYPA